MRITSTGTLTEGRVLYCSVISPNDRLAYFKGVCNFSDVVGGGRGKLGPEGALGPGHCLTTSQLAQVSEITHINVYIYIYVCMSTYKYIFEIYGVTGNIYF